MLRRIALIVGVLFALSASLPAEDAAPTTVRQHHEARSSGPLTVTYDVSPLDTRLGQPFQVTFTAAVDESDGAPRSLSGRIAIEWPDLAKALGRALGEEVVAVEPHRSGSNQRELKAEVRLFDSGRFVLPPLTVSARDTAGEDEPWSVTFEGPELEVTSVLAALTPEEVRPKGARDVLPLPPRSGDEQSVPWLAVAGALAALALAVFAIALLRRRRSAAAPAFAPPPTPAHERALRALDALLSRHLPEQGAVEPYFVELSEILRRYVEDRFGLRAPERTTEEFLAELRQSETGRRAIAAAQRAVLREFLERADLVKFARDEPDLDVCAQAAGAAREFVRGTSPHDVGGA